MKKNIKDNPLEVGNSVMVQGVKCTVSYCPFERDWEPLGWLYIHPIHKCISWVQMINTDEYEELKTDE